MTEAAGDQPGVAFVDRSLASYDAEAAAPLTRRSLDFLEHLG